MADLLNFQIGTQGLDLVTDPLELPPGTLQTAQNVEWVRDAGLSGLGSRASLTPLNSPALAGPVLAAIAVPLPSPVDDATVPTMFLFTSTGVLKSTDGSTFAPLTLTPTPVSLFDDFPFAPKRADVVLLDSGAPVVVYAGTFDGTNTPIAVFNPATGTAATAFTVPGRVSSVYSFAGKVYIGQVSDGFDGVAWDGSSPSTTPISGSVVEYDPNLGSHVLVGQAFGTGVGEISAHTITGSGSGLGVAPVALMDNGSRLYVIVGTQISSPNALASPTNYPDVEAFSIDPASETVWTDEDGGGTTQVSGGQAFDGGGPASGGFSEGQVWWGTQNTDRAAAGGVAPPLAASDGQESPVAAGELTLPTGGSGWWNGFIDFVGLTFVAGTTLDSGGTVNGLGIYVTPDVNNNLALDKDVFAAYGDFAVPGQPYLFGGDLYWPMVGIPGHETDGYLLKRTAGGSWTQAATSVDLSGAAITATVPV